MNMNANANAAISSRDFAERCVVGGAEGEGEQSTAAGSTDGEREDVTVEEEVVESQRRDGSERGSEEDEDTDMDDNEGQVELSSSPRSTLMGLRVPRNEMKQILEAQDPYFAGRLAATSVILMRDELMDDAKRLGQWSVALVGKRAWVKMVESYTSAPRDENDNGA